MRPAANGPRDTPKDWIPATGFSHPDNKANAVALWLLALHDVTGKTAYKTRAEKWYRLMKTRMKTRDNGQYFVWNYWEPAGAWDYKSDGSPKHWVGVHPNGGYYGIDVEAIVAAREHGLVFDQEDMARLIATNRDFMWNQKVEGAAFQSIDGGAADPRWKDTPRRLVDRADTLRRDAAQSVPGQPQARQLGRDGDDTLVSLAAAILTAPWSR